MGPQDQPDFLNAAALLHTDLEPLPLLDLLQATEQAAGRERLRHWGERTLDLDILLFGQQQIRLPRLTVPHVALCEREFALRPLADIAAHWPIPGSSLTVTAALAACNAQGVWYHGPCAWME